MFFFKKAIIKGILFPNNEISSNPQVACSLASISGWMLLTNRRRTWIVDAQRELNVEKNNESIFLLLKLEEPYEFFQFCDGGETKQTLKNVNKALTLNEQTTSRK